MKESHVAFTANGTSIYELAFTGTPSVVIANYEEDLKEISTYERMGFSLSLGLYNAVSPNMIRGAVEKFYDKDFFEESATKGLALTDGFGVKRAAELIVSLLDNLEKKDD
ncbi:MAG: hypothetical protein IME98_02520, partial [Proteobacteria bacterium]|nr:hypothetical protein [Pseudomonadota bacterium]